MTGAPVERDGGANEGVAHASGVTSNPPDAKASGVRAEGVVETVRVWYDASTLDLVRDLRL